MPSPRPGPPSAPLLDARGRKAPGEPVVRVRRIHRRDLNRVWEFLKLVFRDVNRETVEYQRPRHKKHFLEIYEEDGIEQLFWQLNPEKLGAGFRHVAPRGAEMS